MRVIIGLLLLLPGPVATRAYASSETAPPPPRGIDPAPAALAERLAPLNLPPAFVRHIEQRAALDRYLSRELRVSPTTPPAPAPLRLQRARNPAGIRTIHWAPPAAELDWWARWPNILTPVRGFRAPILEPPNPDIIPTLPAGLGPAERAAAQIIQQRLAFDGLTATLAQVLEQLGPPDFLSCRPAELRQLEALGFPADLLAAFGNAGDEDPDDAAAKVVRRLAAQLAAGRRAEELGEELARWPFRVPAAWARFTAAAESGLEEAGLLRLQLGGGFDEGIIPGDSIHVIAQLVAGLPQTDVVVSVPEQVFPPVETWARQALPVRRPGHVTLISTPGKIESWAQDNGKAGWLRAPTGRDGQPALLTPRYASRHEGFSHFLPSESRVVRSLSAAGLAVAQFPLLFQGGNLLVVDEPGIRRRTLLLGEGEVYRNRALGLTPEQILECFRRGFEVDRCVVLPAVSYHLDFDLNVRTIAGEVVAFVNDPADATRRILELGIEALMRRGLMEPAEATALRYELRGGDGRMTAGRLRDFLGCLRQPDGAYPAALAGAFQGMATDSAAGNLQVFLQALIMLESEFAAPALGEPDLEKDAAGQAFRAFDKARRAQLEILAGLGWRLVRVPGVPDLLRGINYLNGLHHRNGYVLPVMGGFYAPLDAVAEAIFRAELGPDAAILPIQCAELQRQHGAVHCAAVLHPVPTRDVTATAPPRP